MDIRLRQVAERVKNDFALTQVGCCGNEVIIQRTARRSLADRPCCVGIALFERAFVDRATRLRASDRLPDRHPYPAAPPASRSALLTRNRRSGGRHEPKDLAGEQAARAGLRRQLHESTNVSSDAREMLAAWCRAGRRSPEYPLMQSASQTATLRFRRRATAEIAPIYGPN